MRQRKYELLQAAAVIYAANHATKDTAVKRAFELLEEIEKHESWPYAKASNPQRSTETVSGKQSL